MSKTRYSVTRAHESVLKKFDEIDNSMKRTEGLIKGLYFLLGIIFVVTIMSLEMHEWWRCRKRC